ncbi:MAG: hypothetical protein JWN86_3449 [Planctomycetota bacterium]|nr:hypothetical protein [Planctomycetota bacterium]
MVSHRTKRLGMSLAASGVLLGFVTAPSLRGDEPSRIGRLFRLGGTTKSSDSTAVGKPASSNKPDAPSRPFSDPSNSTGQPISTSPGYSLPPNHPGTPPSNNRIAPQPRVSKAATESDPMVTRISIGRSDDGKQFCMFMQVFADGTVLDSEGVHKVGAESLRPIAQVIQSGELDKVARYCGGPAADFIEQVQVVTYDRYRGRLRATSFSFSGNPQGCDPSVRHLNAALDALQSKLSGPPVSAPPGSAGNAASGTTGSTSVAPLPSVIPRNAQSIGLSPDS